MLKVWNVFLICADVLPHDLRHVPHAHRASSPACTRSRSRGIGIYFVYFMGVIAAVSIALIIWRLPQLRERRLASSRSCPARRRSSLNNWGFVSLMVVHRGRRRRGRASASGCSTRSRRSGRRSTTPGSRPSRWSIFFADGRSAAARLAQDEPGALPEELPLARRGDARRRRLAPRARQARRTTRPSYDADADLRGHARSRARLDLGQAAVRHGHARRVQHRRRRAGVRTAGSRRGSAARATRACSPRSSTSSRSRAVATAATSCTWASRSCSSALPAARGASTRRLSMSPGETVQIDDYSMTYVGPRMEVDNEKRMIFTDLDVVRQGKPIGRVTPAKFIYKTGAESAVDRGRRAHDHPRRSLRDRRNGQPARRRSPRSSST